MKPFLISANTVNSLLHITFAIMCLFLVICSLEHQDQFVLKSCYYLTTECGSIYNTVSLFVNQVYPAFVDDCENTLSHLQTNYGFPCSSNSLEHNCIDLLGK